MEHFHRKFAFSEMSGTNIIPLLKLNAKEYHKFYDEIFTSFVFKPPFKPVYSISLHSRCYEIVMWVIFHSIHITWLDKFNWKKFIFYFHWLPSDIVNNEHTLLCSSIWIIMSRKYSYATNFNLTNNWNNPLIPRIYVN